MTSLKDECAKVDGEQYILVVPKQAAEHPEPELIIIGARIKDLQERDWHHLNWLHASGCSMMGEEDWEPFEELQRYNGFREYVIDGVRGPHGYTSSRALRRLEVCELSFQTIYKAFEFVDWGCDVVPPEWPAMLLAQEEEDAKNGVETDLRLSIP